MRAPWDVGAHASEADLQAGFDLAAAGAGQREDCPAPGDIWRAAVGEASTGSARALVLHAAACPGCAEAWRLAREISAPRRGIERWSSLGLASPRAS